VHNPLDQAIKQSRSGNPLDAAVLQHDHPDIHAYRKIDEIPFDFERRRVSIVVEHETGRLLITKGAPESVLPVCSRYELNDQEFALDGASRTRCEATYRELCARGFRMLAEEIPNSSARRLGIKPLPPRPTLKNLVRIQRIVRFLGRLLLVTLGQTGYSYWAGLVVSTL